MKKIFLLFTLTILPLCAHGFEIVYPKSDNAKIQSDKTFFIGNENPSKTLTINGSEVPLHPSGGFKYTVNLENQYNTFMISNGEDEKIYKIERIDAPVKEQPVYKEFNTPIIISTSKNNVPLRSTPVNGGINRLQHLQSGIIFTAIGEYGDFYKVKMARDDYGWILKSETSQCDKQENSQARILHYEFSENSTERIYKIKLDKKTPYIISENNGLDVVLYNIIDSPFDRYEFHINTKKLFGYTSYYESDNTLIIKVQNPTKSLQDLIITIDAGHGGNEYGAIGCLGDKEKDINLLIAKKLQQKLIDSGANVFMTREDDIDVSLQDRVKFTNDKKSNIFISIHNNALPDSLADREATGTEVYYFYPQSRKLAQNIIKCIVEKLGLKNNGVIKESFAVIRNTNALSILIETAYIINPDDNAKLQSENFQNDLAEAILYGLENFINEQ